MIDSIVNMFKPRVQEKYQEDDFLFGGSGKPVDMILETKDEASNFLDSIEDECYDPGSPGYDPNSPRYSPSSP